ncbi:MAG: class I SAM-dependent methyltransferase [Ilumatobacter sp.]|nr:class I SAM-dependent methyltransferase [Ilumatobacter sp.]
MDLDRALIAYYEQEVALDRRAELPEHRVRLRDEFAGVLRADGARTLLDVGAGPGLDVVGFAADGFESTGLDLAVGNAAAIRRRGARAVAGSLYALPFRSGSFDAVWTMSTLVHVPDARFDDAVRELLRVVRPGGAVAVGTWGGFDFEGVSEHGDIRPYRFFALRTHERFAALLARHGTVEGYQTMAPNPDSHWEYQFAVLRAP